MLLCDCHEISIERVTSSLGSLLRNHMYDLRVWERVGAARVDEGLQVRAIARDQDCDVFLRHFVVCEADCERYRSQKACSCQ